MDVERLLCVHLHDRLNVPAHYDVPGGDVEEFVTVIQSGGLSNSFGIGSKSMLIQCWSASRQRSATIAEDVKVALRDIILYENVMGYSITSEYRDRDIDRNMPRCCFMVSLDVNE